MEDAELNLWIQTQIEQQEEDQKLYYEHQLDELERQSELEAEEA